MKKISIYSFVILLSFTFNSCKSDVKKEEKSGETKSGMNESTWLEAMKEIDNKIAISDAVANSLYYSKETGESEKLVAYLSQDNRILKVEETFSGKPGEDLGSVTYYLNQTKPLVTIEKFEDRKNPNEIKFVERVSYYNDKGEVTHTKEKRVNYEEELIGLEYQTVDLVSVSTDKIFEILNQKGEYQTTFQGLVETETANYLIVGEPKENGYTSALKIEFVDNFIKEIYKSPKQYLNKKLRVTFQVSRMQGNFEYQVYTGGSWD